jgi:signal transduction histidine kinase
MPPGPDKASDPQKSTSWNSAPASAEKLQRLDRLANLGMLSAGMAHEIKNGMVAVKTFVDLLLEKNQDAELGEVVRHELERINAIVTQMLRMAAPASASFKPVRVHKVLDHSLRLLQPQVSGKLITVKRNYRAETDAVHGDDAQLQQTFMNLLLNALEAMGSNGTLTVSTEITAGDNGVRGLKIKIQDTGTGIAPENLAKLFEPFFTTKKNGTGLGLAICQRIVIEHRGAIKAQSEAGKGSTFSISLPAVEL